MFYSIGEPVRIVYQGEIQEGVIVAVAPSSVGDYIYDVRIDYMGGINISRFQNFILPTEMKQDVL